MVNIKLKYFGLISLFLMTFTSCSKFDLEQDVIELGKDDSYTRADLIEYTIHVETAGTLDSLLQVDDYSDAQKLIITGNLSYEDVHYVDENMFSVEVLDLSGASYNTTTLENFFLSSSTLIKEISLPNNIVNIGDGVWGISGSFYRCSSLISVNIPESMKRIGCSAFYGCSSLTNINIPEGLTEIGQLAFFDCEGLTSITLPKGTYINDRTFMNCSSLTSINIEGGITGFLQGTFSGCSSLTSITLSEECSSIMTDAFADCRSLTSINIPNGVYIIGPGAFEGCSSLASINIPQSVTSIGEIAFWDCSSLTSINIPEGVTSIENRTFSGCSSLTNINIPEGVKSIGYEAFSGCSSLTNIVLPKEVTSIGERAFWNCRSLKNFELPENLTSIGSFAFCNCTGFTNINIPESVTSLGDKVFYGCDNLTSIIIPSTVKETNGSVVAGCNSLQKVIWNSSANVGDLNEYSNKYCWLILNCADNEPPLYGPNWKNVVINGVADKVVLPSLSTMDFVIPQEVKTINKISYKMTFETTNYYYSYGMWKTISLPFTPTEITHKEKGVLAPFDSDVEGALNFWLRELTEDGFQDVTSIKAHHPYVIAMPCSNYYEDMYNISGDVTFSAENPNPEELSSDHAIPATGEDFTMYPAYTYLEATDGIFVLDGLQFIEGLKDIHPFEAYIQMNTSSMRSMISLSKGRIATRAYDSSKRMPKVDDM